MPDRNSETIADVLAEKLFPLKEVFQRQNALENRMSVVEVELRADRAAALVQNQQHNEKLSNIHANLADQDLKLDALVKIGSETAGAWKANKFWLAVMGGAITLLVAILVAYIEIGKI